MTLNRWIDGNVTWGNILTLAVMLVSMLTGYVKLIDCVDAIAAELAEHKQEQAMESATYVRRDVQDTRNRFIDERLDEMNRKLDILIERRSR